MKFKSKIDWWIHLLFAGLVVGAVWSVWTIFSLGWIGIILFVAFAPVTAFFIVPVWMNTYYYLDEDELLIKSGLGKGTRIGYSQITSVCRTRNPISSPALSLDRLEIKYKVKSGRFSDIIVISPEDKHGFIEQLRIKNESIETSDDVKQMPKSMKFILVASAIISVLTLIWVGAMFIYGDREPVVTVDDDSIRISAMYGTSIRLVNITDISLLEQSMREIGAGSRTNGYGGRAWKGHFNAGLLFVRPDSSPTIRIERDNGTTVFISFQDAARTISLYSELSSKNS